MNKLAFLLATSSLMIVACGKSVSASSKPQSAGVQPKESVAAVGDSSFMLDFPAELLRIHDLIKLRLVSADGVTFERNFDSLKEKIKIERLPAGQYAISVDLFQKGEIKEHGIGKVMIEAGKVAVAEVVLNPVEGEKSGSFIVKVVRQGEGGPFPMPIEKVLEALPVLSEKIAAVVLSETRAVDGCNGFRFEFVRESGNFKFQGCSPLNGQPVNLGIKLSPEKMELVEKYLASLKYVPSEKIQNCLAELVAPGEKVRTLTIKDKDGKEIEFLISAGGCGEGKIGTVSPALFDSVAKSFMTFLVPLR